MNQIADLSNQIQNDFQTRVEPEFPAIQDLTPRGAIWLAALGTAARLPATQDEIGHLVQALSQPSWEPSGSLVEEAVYDMVSDSFLAAEPPLLGEPRFAPSAKGRAALNRLMMARISHVQSPFGQACIRIKLAFLDLLHSRERSQLLEKIARHYERELIVRRNNRQPFQTGLFGQSWHDETTERLRRELVLLRTFAYTHLNEELAEPPA